MSAVVKKNARAVLAEAERYGWLRDENDTYPSGSIVAAAAALSCEQLEIIANWQRQTYKLLERMDRRLKALEKKAGAP